MVTRLILRLPWFASVPALVVGAVVLAAGLNLVAGAYFERTFRDDTDPLLGIALPGSLSTAAETTAPASVPPIGGAQTAATPPAPAVTPPAAAAPSAAPPITTAPAAAAPATPAPVSATPTPAVVAAAPAATIATAPVAAAPVAASGPVLLSEGDFFDGDPGHNGSGRARLIRGADGTHTLRFENFSVTNGPDLFVILSADPAGSRGSAAAESAINLGRLKATDGNVNYAVPAGTDLSGVRSVIIYCRAFRVVFAAATLEAR